MSLNESKIFIPKGNLKIPRRNMPQVDSKHFTHLLKWLKSQGVSVRQSKAQGIKLKPIQKEINIQAVEQLMKTNDPKLRKPFLITKDGFILDGHHRWLALLQSDRKIIVDAIQINLKVKDALRILREYPRVTFKDKNNAEYNIPDPNLKLETTEMPITESERFVVTLREHLEGIDPDILDGNEYALIVQEALTEISAGVVLNEEETPIGDFKEFFTEAKKKRFKDPKERVVVRGFGSVRVGDLEKMIETRMKEVDTFRKKKDWRNVRHLITNTAILPLLDVLKEVQDAND